LTASPHRSLGRWSWRTFRTAPADRSGRRRLLRCLPPPESSRLRGAATGGNGADGGRAIARIRPDGQVCLDSRNAKDFTPAFPEVTTALGEALPGRRLTLDGELVAANPTTGAPDFAQLQITRSA
jgi:ATP dependent DNA ligase domain